MLPINIDNSYFLFTQVDLVLDKADLFWQALLFINGYQCMEYTSSEDFACKIPCLAALPGRSGQALSPA